MSKIRQNDELNEEIEELKSLRDKIPPYDIFGGNNIEKIQAEITTLESFTDEDEIYERYDSNYEEYNEDDPSQQDQEIINVALDALCWKFGETNDKPSTGWKNLVTE